MIKEKAALFQQSRLIDGEKIKARGLRAFYNRMANPSLEYLSAVTSGLSVIHLDTLWRLSCATENAAQNPTAFFAKEGLQINESPKFRRGIYNAAEVIDTLRSKFDYDSGYIPDSEHFDPKCFAEVVLERIQFDNSGRRLREAMEKTKAEPNLSKRYRRGLALKKQVLNHIGSFDFFFYTSRRDKQIDPTWENLTLYGNLNAELRTKDGGSVAGYLGGFDEGVIVAEAAMKRYPLEKRLAKLPMKDQNRFEELRLKYGAKAANLILLSELTGRINQARGDKDELVVPEFRVLSVDSYRAWREGRLSDSDLLPFFKWAERLKAHRHWGNDENPHSDYIVRSSAVFSEDGATMTGAGIYESVRISGGSSFEDFKNAVTCVYESTDSPKAQSYRVQHGISEEEMGLLIQKYIDLDTTFVNYSQAGYANSRLEGVPQLMEIVTESSRNLVKREELDFYLGLSSRGHMRAFESVHHFLPDKYKIRPELIIRAALLTATLERIWGDHIQIEFVADGLATNFVQVRELPKGSFSRASEVQFPDETPVHKGSAIGTGIMELPVLGTDDNSDKTGLAIFATNEMFTVGDKYYRLPKAGAVVVCDGDGKNGHIQTLCAERGLICIFPDGNEEMRSPYLYHDLSKLRKVRIVANGIEGRVYAIQQGDLQIEEQNNSLIYS